MTNPEQEASQPTTDTAAVCNCRFAWHFRGIQGCIYWRPRPGSSAANDPNPPTREEN
jgi:hypothetical protein